MLNNRAGKVPVWQKMGLLFVMYLMQNICLGFTWVLLPLLLRKQGLSLGCIGFSALIYSPWAFKFLWASRIDRHYHSRWGRRKSWIAPLSGLTVLLIPVLGVMNPQTQLPLILVVVFILNLIIATTDIAVDGYATDILHPKEMSMGNTAQSVGYTTGHMLGSGVFLILYQTTGWTLTLFIMAGLYLVLYNIIMNLSVGHQAATNYAVLCSLNHVILLSILPIAGFVCDATGYPVFFTGLFFFSLLSLIAGSGIMNRHLGLR